MRRFRGRLGRGCLSRWFGTRWGVRCGQVSGKNPSQLDLIDVRKMRFEVGIALFGDQVLPGGLTVVSVNFVDCVHAR